MDASEAGFAPFDGPIADRAPYGGVAPEQRSRQLEAFRGERAGAQELSRTKSCPRTYPACVARPPRRRQPVMKAVRSRGDEGGTDNRYGQRAEPADDGGVSGALYPARVGWPNGEDGTGLVDRPQRAWLREHVFPVIKHL
jgi:hypothetical protein